jgi:hypothetical protein
MTPNHRLIENIVVYQGRGVNHLDDRRQNRMSGCHRAARPSRQEQKRGAQPLPLVIATVIDQTLHKRESAAKLVLENSLGVCKLGTDRCEQVSQRASRALDFQHRLPHHTRLHFHILFQPL